MVSEHGNIPQVDSFLASLLEKSSLSEINEWDAEAQRKIDELKTQVKKTRLEIEQLEKQVVTFAQEHSQKGFFQKLIANRGQEKEIHEKIANLRIKVLVLNDYIEALLADKDFSPNSPEDLKSLLAELKAYKKELQLKKREVNAELTSIRAEARQKSAEAAYSGFFTTPAIERRKIRISKEAAIAPHEDVKIAIEKQLIALERKIAWLTKVHK
jgi:ribosomal protein L20A (L18A)